MRDEGSKGGASGEVALNGARDLSKKRRKRAIAVEAPHLKASMVAISNLQDRELDPSYFHDDLRADRSRVQVQRVALAWEYPVHFTHDVFSWENLTLCRTLTRREPRVRHGLVVLAGRAVLEAHPSLVEDVARYVDVHRERLTLVAPPVVVEPSSAEAETALREAIECAPDARPYLIAIGGRSLQELAGRAAAATRNMRLVRLPTTVLAQSDVTTIAADAVRSPAAPPIAVICDFDFLRTLSRRDTISGFSAGFEAALHRDASLFSWLRVSAMALADGDRGAIQELVRRCATPHVEHVADGFSGTRIELGRFVASALVDIAKRELRHGEALALALAIDSVRSVAAGALDADVLDTILSTMDVVGLPTHHPILDSEALRSTLVERVRDARAEAGGAISTTLLEGVGLTVDVDDVDEAAFLQAIDFLRHRGAGRCRR